RVIHANQVIRCYKNRGPVFGNYFFMVNDSKVWSYRHDDSCYEKRLRSDSIYSLLIDEFEVFQVLKN
ncbi:15644_t:CDS:1, partial [Dentiscutata erythropus]